MFRGMIDYLTFGYTFLCKGRGKLRADELTKIQGGATTVVIHAEEVLGDGTRTLTADERADLEEARKICEHIEEMSVFLQTLEIV